MSDKQTAPCGHEGEVVIGAYVRCLKGCAKDPRTTPPAPPRRAQAGHVDFCACRPCTIRRRARQVVVRTKDGKEARFDWDGATDHVEWTSTIRGFLRHWKMVDEDGDIVEEGTIFDREETHVGDIISFDFLQPAFLIWDAAILIVRSGGFLNRVRRHYPDFMR